MRNLLYRFVLAAGVAATQTPSLAAGPEIWTTQCMRIAGKAVKMKAPCTVKVYARATSATEEWEWDNGTRTTVKMSDEGTFVDGQEAEERDASKLMGSAAYCYGIKASGEIYCWAK